ncbi:DUF4255 domain-containing protein [Synechococcus sp. PCC 7336]|uniref:DUF4255 domain-containing protein n=1 Tax=Synechococcus sp. PCC 7336 TaxID=195250 RepID=UPI00034B2F5B|nr:DUF4255 domain-containing protein [Synechococcus sp. PCC 7336]
MIFDALKLIRDSLESYILQVEAPPDRPSSIVVLGNIGLAQELGGTNTNLNNQVVVTLVNVQEETSLKNLPHYRQENGKTVYRNPPVSLNLFILFSVLHSEAYDTALKRLSRVVEFFQWQKEFSFTTTPGAGNLSRDVRIYPDLYSLTFEQLNHLWGALGGKQVPFVLYKARVVALEAEKRQAEGVPIAEIHINES